MRGEFLDLDGARLYCYAAGTRGRGEPVLFVHGFATSSHLWGAIVPLVPAGHRVVVLDLLGCGRSDRPLDRDLSLAGHAARIVAACDVLGIERACLVGHGLGAAVAAAVAIDAPDRVARLCCINAVMFDGWMPRTFRALRAAPGVAALLPAPWLAALVYATLRSGYLYRRSRAHSLALYARAFAGADGRRALLAHLAALDEAETLRLGVRLHQITIPTAVVCGRNDPCVPADTGERMHRAISGSSLDVLADTRHFAPEEAPEAVATVLTRLLAR